MEAQAEHEVVYDIRLQDRVPEALVREFPSMRVRTTGPRTVLRLEVERPEQLPLLLEKVRSVGGSITGLHRCAAPGRGYGTGVTYEVWVRYVLGASLLWYLDYEHHVVPQQTQVRVALGTGTLQRFVRTCASCGVTVDQVRRVDPAPPPPVIL